MPESRVLVVLAMRSWGMGGLGTVVLAVGVAVAEGVAEATGVLLGGAVALVVGVVVVVEPGAVDVGVVVGGVVEVVTAAPEQPAEVITRTRTTERTSRSRKILTKRAFENMLIVSFVNQ